MIEINLLAGSSTKARHRRSGPDVARLAATLLARVKDPYLLGAVSAAVVAALAVGSMFWYQRAQAMTLDTQLQRAEQDSIRFAAVIREKRKAEAQRDSVVRQVELIRSFDDKRFVWPHIMDEVSRALPPYTWLTSISQTSAAVPASSDTTTADSASVAPPPVQFRLVGNTVDIQALTRFMKLLEASPFIEDVQLIKSTLILVDGKQITEFQLDAAYQRPDSSAVRTTPFSLAVR